MTRNRLLRRKVYERDKGICCDCSRFDPKWEADHDVELWEGGRDVLENLKTRCRHHHRVKTSAAAPARAKTDRLRARHELTQQRRKVGE
jgi:5-methylcytosine-specific restriction endonuclease McrA